MAENFDLQLDNQLNQYGYNFLFKIMTKSFDGKEKIYVKCTNPKGQYVYVLIDNEINNKSIEYEETNENYIPLSFKSGIMDCAELGVCGVAFDCKDSMCVIDLDNKLNYVEKTFKIITDRPERIAISENEIIACPIITIHEIKQNPNEILKICDEIIKKIRFVNFNKMDENLKKFENNLNCLKDNFDNIKCILEDTKNKLKNSFVSLETYYDYFASNPPCIEEKYKEESIKYNLAKSNESFIDYTNLNYLLCEENPKIIEMNNNILEYIKYAKKKFELVGFIQTK